MLKLYLKTFEVKNAHETVKLPKEKAKKTLPFTSIYKIQNPSPRSVRITVRIRLRISRKNSVEIIRVGVFFLDFS